MLKASSITKIFKSPSAFTLFENIDLDVKAEESLAIMGASGVGKSTLLHILGTLEKPDSGTISILDRSTSSHFNEIRNQEIGFIFQSFFLLEHLSLLENVLMPASIARLPVNKDSEAYLRALELLKKVGLFERRFHLTKTLSGGEKQRACIARALCNNPSIIFADEPTGNLDSQSSKAIQSLLLNYIREEKKTLVVVTHDLNFAKSCDRILCLLDGKLRPYQE